MATMGFTKAWLVASEGRAWRSTYPYAVYDTTEPSTTR
jgi:hypothetical protein